MAFPWGAAISAGGNLIGGLLGQRRGKTSATHGVRWRVADARKAGINPIYALGGSFGGDTYGASSGLGAAIEGAAGRVGEALSARQLARQEAEEREKDRQLTRELERERRAHDERLAERRMLMEATSRSRLDELMRRDLVNPRGPIDPMRRQYGDEATDWAGMSEAAVDAARLPTWLLDLLPNPQRARPPSRRVPYPRQQRRSGVAGTRGSIRY